jgi:hypothetical protein
MGTAGSLELKSDFEIHVSQIRGDFLDSGISDVAGKIFLNLLYAIVDVFRRALGEHLDGAVRHVADEAGELMAIGHPMSDKAKTNALDPAGENYMSGNHFLMDY